MGFKAYGFRRDRTKMIQGILFPKACKPVRQPDEINCFEPIILFHMYNVLQLQSFQSCQRLFWIFEFLSFFFLIVTQVCLDSSWLCLGWLMNVIDVSDHLGDDWLFRVTSNDVWVMFLKSKKNCGWPRYISHLHSHSWNVMGIETTRNLPGNGFTSWCNQQLRNQRGLSIVAAFVKSTLKTIFK